MNTGQEQLPAEATPLFAALRAFAHAHVAPLSAGPGTAHSWVAPPSVPPALKASRASRFQRLLEALASRTRCARRRSRR